VKIHIKELKMCKTTKHKYHSTQAQRREVQSQKIQGPNERRTMTNPNPNPNTINQCNTYVGPF
jgi:hypothetical protein